MPLSLDQLERQLEELMQVKVYDESIKKGVDEILSAMPAPERENNHDLKVRLLQLRCRTRMLLPFPSKEAEKDFHAALKLRPDMPDTWVELSECFMRRNAFKEACDALDSALAINPLNTAALCKYSQIQRNRCGETSVAAAQKKAYMEDAIAKARAAVQSNVKDGEAWHTLSLALLAEATSEHLRVEGVRKAVAAMQQAASHVRGDPDLHYNKGVLESLIGNFGTAASEFAAAHELDNHRLKGTQRLCECNVAILRRAQSRMSAVSGIAKHEFKRIRASVSAALVKAAPDKSSCFVGVLDILSDAIMQPLAILGTNDEGIFSIVLLYEVNQSAFKIGDVLSFPASTPSTVVKHSVPSLSILDMDAVSLSIRHYFPSLSQTRVNEKSLPTSSRVPLQMSSRLFA